MKATLYQLRWLATMGVMAYLLVGGPAFAQGSSGEDAAKPSSEQARLNSSAVDAIVEEDYERAIKLLEASIELGELNITWLNLGRAYQKNGECEKARDAYLSAVSAPAVESPSPRIIEGKVDQYLGELEEECAEVDDEARQTAEAEGSTRGDEEVDRGDEDDDQLAHLDDADASNGGEAPDSAASAPSGGNALGWTITGTGLAMAGGGVGLHLWAESVRGEVERAQSDAGGDVISSMSREEAYDKQSQANTLDTLSIGTLVAGAVVTGGGLYMVFSSDNVEAAPSAAVSGDGDVHFGFHGRF